ncbi:MAG: aminoacyl-tRNA hydrolase [Chloroflexi bacterium]|nr:aminoacyl-tRNA hydrolase [Chloroflexota bacterium]
MKLIVGLGNPGRKYAGTRHNAGARCVLHLARVLGTEWRRRYPLALVAPATIADRPALLARNRTFMNESGRAVAFLVERYGVNPQRDLLVVHDDLDLPLGTIRLRGQGSSGGHKGVASTIALLGTQQFSRIRVGIGRPPPGVDVVEYVLSSFDPPEEAAFQGVMEQVAESIKAIVSEGLEGAMNRFN